MPRRLIFLVIILIIIVFILLTVFLSKPHQQANPVPVFNTSPTPTATTATEELILQSSNPISDPSGKNNFSPISKVVFTFNKSVVPSSLKISTSPEVEVDAIFSDDYKQLTIQPKGLAFWKPYTVYTVRILAGLQSIDNSLLKNDIIYQLQAVTQGGV